MQTDFMIYICAFCALKQQQLHHTTVAIGRQQAKYRSKLTRRTQAVPSARLTGSTPMNFSQPTFREGWESQLLNIAAYIIMVSPISFEKMR
jgi:hypothetical protein